MINRHPKLRLSLPSLRRKIDQILKILRIPNATLEVTLASDAVVRRQNRIHMGYDKNTDVLSFPSQPPQKKISNYKNQFLGDVLVSLDRARIQASQQKISLEKEVLFLLVHSILHLIGYDHATVKERESMQRKESEIWKALNKT